YARGVNKPCPSLDRAAYVCVYHLVDQRDLVEMAEAPTTGGEVLTPNDAVKVLEELLPAQNQSYELGLRLNLK
ncbi:hypothetical protein GBAR_LOCUS20627, partial [Geodia barretti]